MRSCFKVLVTLYLFMFADFLSLTHFTAGMLRIIPLQGHAGKQKGGGCFFSLACNKQKVAISQSNSINVGRPKRIQTFNMITETET